jgi:hypothetical protein
LTFFTDEAVGADELIYLDTGDLNLGIILNEIIKDPSIIKFSWTKEKREAAALNLGPADADNIAARLGGDIAINHIFVAKKK